jgi:tetratricopeptide (TPR) repeat protein
VGNGKQAVDRLERAIELDPLNVIHVSELARANIFLRRFEEAERRLDRAIALEPAFEQAYTTKFLLYLNQLGDTVKAHAYWQDQQPTLSAGTSANWRAHLEYYRRNYQAALQNLQNVSQPDLVRVALLYHAAGQRESERIYADSLLAQAGDLLQRETQLADNATGIAWTHWRLGIAYALLGNSQSANLSAQRALANLPLTEDAVNGTTVLAWAALVYVLTGQYEAAIDHLETLLSVPSTYTAARLKLEPSWDPLRDHPRFQALLAKYQ